MEEKLIDKKLLEHYHRKLVEILSKTCQPRGDFPTVEEMYNHTIQMSYGIRKSYETLDLANQDINPIDLETSKPLKVGQLVSVVADPNISNNAIYRLASISADGTPTWQFQEKLGDMSVYVKKKGDIVVGNPDIANRIQELYIENANYDSSYSVGAFTFKPNDIADRRIKLLIYRDMEIVAVIDLNNFDKPYHNRVLKYASIDVNKETIYIVFNKSSDYAISGSYRDISSETFDLTRSPKILSYINKETRQFISNSPFFDSNSRWATLIDSVSIINRDENYDYALSFFNYNHATGVMQFNLARRLKGSLDFVTFASIKGNKANYTFGGVQLIDTLERFDEVVFVKFKDFVETEDIRISLKELLLDAAFNVSHFNELINSVFIEKEDEGGEEEEEYSKSTIDDDTNRNIKELYIIDPDKYNSNLYVSSILFNPDTSSNIRFTIRDEEWNIIAHVALDGVKDIGIYKTKVFPIYEFNKPNIFGYVVLKNGAYKSNSTKIAKIINKNTTLDKNPSIKDFLSNNSKSQILLSGSSTWGYNQENSLRELVIGETGARVYNAGFGGCRMSWRTPDGSSDYDKFSFTDIVDALVENDFSSQIEANTNLDGKYDHLVADITNIDLNNPTVLFIAYISNDVTGATPIGELWNNEDDYLSYDRTTFLGAFNRGIIRLLDAYPKTRIIATTGMYRKVNNLPPFLYKNNIGKSAVDYADALIQNCNRLGITVWDTMHLSGRNPYNWDEMSVDSSHFNYNGYKLMAKKIGRIYEGSL